MAAPDPAVPPLVVRLLDSFDARVNDAPLPRPRSRGEWRLPALLALRSGAED